MMRAGSREPIAGRSASQAWGAVSVSTMTERPGLLLGANISAIADGTRVARIVFSHLEQVPQ